MASVVAAASRSASPKPAANPATATAVSSEKAMGEAK